MFERAKQLFDFARQCVCGPIVPENLSPIAFLEEKGCEASMSSIKVFNMNTKRLLLTFAVFGISVSSSIAVTFSQLDKDKDGYATREEVIAFFESDHKNMDKDKDGIITKDEWPASSTVFNSIDTSKDGELSFEELGEWRCASLLGSKDKDKDGMLDIEEYEADQAQ